MDFTLSTEHEALRDSAQVFLDKEVNLAPLLQPGATVEKAGYDALWSKIVDLGWAGIVIPEAYGGIGLSYIDLIMIIGEMGRTLAPAPLFGTLAGAWAVEKAGSEQQKEALLGAVASSGLKLALAVADADGGTDGPASDAKATAAGAGWTISGSKSFVVDAASADKLIVAAQSGGERDFFVLDAKTAGVSIERIDWRDITRQVCSVSFSNVPAQRLDASKPETWSWVRDRLYLVLATESSAGTRKVLDDAVAYAKERIAFGRPIGSYQVIKHQLADIFALSECAAAAVQYAAWALTESDARAPLAAASAQSYASEAYREATYRNIQVFGAIGFTWEMANHLYYKRARCNAELLGAPRLQREAVVRFLEEEAALAA
jgi:alkylation response protein AidB-like acyl-CoA dehydrogenase